MTLYCGNKTEVMVMDLKDHISEKCDKLLKECKREICKLNWKLNVKESKKKLWRNGG